jgi:catechol 2,3-dioxygenase-like lactoylglutathione lyase family enzyme
MTETQARPGKIAAITLFVEDLDESKRFYQSVFNLSAEFEDDNSAAFKFGNAIINLLKTAEGQAMIAPAKVASRDAGARAQFTLLVDDVDAKCADLTAKGVALINGPIDRPWGIRTACFADPAGHIWEITKW